MTNYTNRTIAFTNNIVLIGNLGSDPELRTVGQNKVAEFNIATECIVGAHRQLKQTRHIVAGGFFNWLLVTETNDAGISQVISMQAAVIRGFWGTSSRSQAHPASEWAFG